MPHLFRSLALALLIAAPLPALAQDATGLWRSEATEEGYIEVKIAPAGPHFAAPSSAPVISPGPSSPIRTAASR